MKKQYPTELHEKSAIEITEFFSRIEDVKAVLLTCSCARGVATSDSCLDIAVLLPFDLDVKRKEEIITCWNKEHESNKLFKQLRIVGKYSHIDLGFINGDFKEGYHCWASGPDEFEVEIGNYVYYSKPLYEKDDYFEKLRNKWLPYYNDQLRKERFEMVKGYFLNNLHHIPVYVDRELYF